MFQLRNAIACEFLPLLDYKQIYNEVFVGQDINSEHFEDLLQNIHTASQRITNVYGNPESKPRIFITSDSETALNWGANETASMLRLPWRSCIVVGPKGQNIDVISHELLHAEIQHRVGLWKLLNEIPVWFDEGAALTHDYREPFLPKNINLSNNKVISVRLLKKTKDFFDGNIRENYQSARMAVIPMIQAEHFFKNLQRISNGERFHSVFLLLTSQYSRPTVMPTHFNFKHKSPSEDHHK